MIHTIIRTPLYICMYTYRLNQDSRLPVYQCTTFYLYTGVEIYKMMGWMLVPGTRVFGTRYLVVIVYRYFGMSYTGTFMIKTGINVQKK